MIQVSTNQEKISLNEPPSLFMIKTIFLETFKKKGIETNMEIDDFEVKHLPYISSQLNKQFTKKKFDYL